MSSGKHRFFAVNAGGSSPIETIFYIIEFENMRDLADHWDRTAADPEVQSALQGFLADPPVTSASLRVLREIEV